MKKTLILLLSIIISFAGYGQTLMDPLSTPTTTRVNDAISAALTATGTDTYSVSINGTYTFLYLSGKAVSITFTNPNTGASTLDFDGLGVKNIKKWSSGSLAAVGAGDLTGTIRVRYDGTQWVMEGGAIPDLTGYQPLDSDLTAIAGLSASNDDFIQRKSGSWSNRTVSQVKTDLGLSGTNSGDNAANTTSNTYADGKVADVITDGVTTVAPSENATYDALQLRVPFNPTTFRLNASDNLTLTGTSSWSSYTGENHTIGTGVIVNDTRIDGESFDITGGNLANGSISGRGHDFTGAGAKQFVSVSGDNNDINVSGTLNGAYMAGQNNTISGSGGNAIGVFGDGITATTPNTLHIQKLRFGLGTNGSLTQDDTLQWFGVRDYSTGELKLRKINNSSASTTGFLSSTDWSNFNNKIGGTLGPDTTYINGSLASNRTLRIGSEFNTHPHLYEYEVYAGENVTNGFTKVTYGGIGNSGSGGYNVTLYEIDKSTLLANYSVTRNGFVFQDNTTGQGFLFSPTSFEITNTDGGTFSSNLKSDGTDTHLTRNTASVDIGLTIGNTGTVSVKSTNGFVVNPNTLGGKTLTVSSAATNDDPEETIYQNRVSTTNATVTTLHTLATTNDNTILITGLVLARRTGGASGVSGDGAGYRFEAVYKNVGGTLTQLGATITAIGESQAGWDVTLTTSSANILVRVTGATSNNITWHLAELKVSQLGS